jgi:hypothetical protein
VRYRKSVHDSGIRLALRHSSRTSTHRATALMPAYVHRQQPRLAKIHLPTNTETESVVQDRFESMSRMAWRHSWACALLCFRSSQGLPGSMLQMAIPASLMADAPTVWQSVKAPQKRRGSWLSTLGTTKKRLKRERAPYHRFRRGLLRRRQGERGGVDQGSFVGGGGTSGVVGRLG